MAAAAPRMVISLVVPTRQRPEPLARMLASLLATARRPGAIEVVLVVDQDDPASLQVQQPGLLLTRVVVAPGLRMGELNRAGQAAARGELIMLLNDDVIARTPGWDGVLRAAFRHCPDGILLAHVNDTLIRRHLCVFPVVSRSYCEIAGGICPGDYRRYRIDDHVEDVFNLLGVLGARRTVYLPDVVFEHTNAVAGPGGKPVYLSKPAVLAEDAPRFEAHAAARKELALRLLAHIEGGSDPVIQAARRRRLEGVTDPFALRVPGRQRVVRTASPWQRVVTEPLGACAALVGRARGCVRQQGYRGLAAAVGRRCAGVLPGRSAAAASREAEPGAAPLDGTARAR